MRWGAVELSSEMTLSGLYLGKKKKRKWWNNILLCCYGDTHDPFIWPDTYRRRKEIHWIQRSFSLKPPDPDLLKGKGRGHIHKTLVVITLIWLSTSWVEETHTLATNYISPLKRRLLNLKLIKKSFDWCKDCCSVLNSRWVKRVQRKRQEHHKKVSTLIIILQHFKAVKPAFNFLFLKESNQNNQISQIKLITPFRTRPISKSLALSAKEKYKNGWSHCNGEIFK